MGEQIESVCIKKIRVDEGANIKYRFDELEGTKKNWFISIPQKV